jgi:PAS domain S-box-containing protein
VLQKQGYRRGVEQAVLSLDDAFGDGATALRGALDGFPDPAGILAAQRGADGTIEELVVLFGNRAAEGLLGIDLKSAPLRLTEIAPTVREDGVFELFCGVIETGEPWLGDQEFGGIAGANRLDGTFQIRAVRMGDGVLFLVRDVSALRAFESEVERVTAIVENTDDAILGADADGLITHWNPGAERLLGWSAEEALGKPLARVVRAEDRDAQAERFRELLAGRRVDRIEARWVRRDRTLVDVIITASPMVVRDGTVIGASAVVHDVTARRRVEAELERSNAELRRFADVAAPDIREPLAAIARFAEVLGADTQTQLGERGEEALRYIAMSIERARRLVDGLRDYAQVGRGELVREEVGLGPLVTALLPTLSATLAGADARVEVGELPVVLADADELARVFQNLIVNSVKYRSDEPPVIEIGARRNVGSWTISVADNGSGIAPGDASRVFEIFARGVGDEIPGSGVGLAVCQKIVERHGGLMWIEPRVAPGTEVRFTLPDVLAPADGTGPPDPEAQIT